MNSKKEKRPKKSAQKLLSLFLAILMLITIIPWSNVAYAYEISHATVIGEVTDNGDGISFGQDLTRENTETEIYIEEQSYDNLQEAFDNVENGETIIIKTNGIIQLTETIDIPKKQNITLKGIVIDGLSEKVTIMSPENDGRHLIINDDCELTFENIILDGGNKSGGIEVNEKESPNTIIEVKITGATIQNCYAKDSGGALKCSGQSIVTIDYAEIRNNTAQQLGGGVYAFFPEKGSITIKDSCIEGNKALVLGGGMFCNSPEMTLYNTKVLNNETGSMGGGIYIGGDKATITQCHIEGNKSTNAGSSNRGGGIYCSGNVWSIKTMEVNGGTISKNEAEQGGGIYIEGNAKVDIKDGCRIEENISSKEGGGIFCGIKSKTTIDLATIKGNQSNRDGGGIFAYGAEIYITNSHIEDNKTLISGGGISTSAEESIIEIDSTDIKNNNAGGSGGGIDLGVLSKNEIRITNCNIEGNEAMSGGGIYALGDRSGKSIIKLHNNSINYNKAIIGGGMYLTGNFEAYQTDIMYNEAEMLGGGICMSNLATVNINDSKIKQNIANQYGGGIYFDGGNDDDHVAHIISDTCIANNKAEINGGGIYSHRWIELNNSSILDNEAGNDGGGIYLDKSRKPQLTIKNSNIKGNTSDRNGGGIYFDGKNSYGANAHIISDTCIANNKAEINGGGIYSHRWIELNNSSILDNEAGNDGGGIYLNKEYSPELTIKNSKIESNNAGRSGGGIDVDWKFENLYIDEDVTFSNNTAERTAEEILDEHIVIHESNVKTNSRSIPTKYAYNNYDVGYYLYKVDLYVDNVYKGTVKVNYGHNINGKIPEEIAALVVGDWYEGYDYTEIFDMNTGITEDRAIYAKGIPTFDYEVNYLEEGTNKPLADKLTGSGILGQEVTERAIDIPGYNKIGLMEKTITINEEDNVINFYYTEYEKIKDSNLYTVTWKYETGYNTGEYDDKYYMDGEGSPEEIQYYVDLHYDSDYTYDTHTIKTEQREVEVVVDLTTGSAITGSAVTKTAIKTETVTYIELFYSRNKEANPEPKPKPGSKPGGTNPTTNIPNPEVPLAELEKNDHYAYVVGYPDGNVKPLNKITREEVAMIFYRLLTDESRNNMQSDYNSFMDLEGHDWSNRAISTLYNAGIISGYPDQTFKPSAPITRAEFATIAAKFDELKLENTSKFTDIVGHWAEKYITSSENNGWIKGYPDMTFKPEQDITRAEAMTLINNVLKRAVNVDNIHPEAIFWPDMEMNDWYYEAVMEATNSHDYIKEEDNELWIGIRTNKVWP